MFDLDGDLLSEALRDAQVGVRSYHGAVGQTFADKYPRTPEREAMIRTTCASALQPFISAAFLGEIAAQQIETKEKWAYRRMALGAVQSIFTTDSKWENIAECIWPVM